MPDRLIRDELLDSDRYCLLSSDTARMLFFHFLLVADDLGNAEATSLFIRRRLMPHPISDEAQAKIIAELADADLVRVYIFEGKRYIHIPRFRQRLRSLKRINPRPPTEIECSEIKDMLHKLSDKCQSSACQVPVKCQTLAGEEKEEKEEKRREETPSRDPAAQESLDGMPPFGLVEPGEPKNGNKPKPPDPPGFTAFWSAYPPKHKDAKKDCLALWRKQKLETKAGVIIGHVRAMCETEKWREGYSFAPLRYLKGEMWEDGLPEMVPVVRRLAL